VFAGKLQQVGFLARLGFVSDNNNGATGFCLHRFSSFIARRRLPDLARGNGKGGRPNVLVDNELVDENSCVLLHLRLKREL
jgi:hypothetical protein